MKGARDLWYECGMAQCLAHPPSDSGAPEEWPDAFTAFRRAIEVAEGQATDNALRTARLILFDENQEAES